MQFVDLIVLCFNNGHKIYVDLKVYLLNENCGQYLWKLFYIISIIIYQLCVKMFTDQGY